ncbi:MAG: Helix-turn-helix domain [Verrucomicrobiales bacterium]|nr:Helix-turn-helix domain [Verrucomicrobiales bacterium]
MTKPKNPTQIPAALLRVSEAADVLTVSPWTVRRLVHTGELESRRIGAALRIKRASVDRLLA